MAAAVEACAARVGGMEVGSVTANHVAKVAERAPEATEKEVAAEGEMAQQRVEEAREVVARVVATEVAAAIEVAPAVVVMPATAMATTSTTATMPTTTTFATSPTDA